MSVDPVAMGGAALDAMISAELTSLAADAQALQAQVAVGQIVQAQVLASNGLTDLLNILGNRVSAQLPPGVQPGDQLTVQVTGFNGTQILLQILDTAPAAATGSPPSTLAGAAAPPPVVSDAAPPGLTETPLAAAATRVLPEGLTPSVAPPPAVFVAASVRPAAAPSPPAPPPVAAGEPPPVLPSPAAAAASAAMPVLGEIEARLAAARAGSIGVTAPGPANAAVPAGAPPPAPPPSAAAPPPPLAGQPAAAPVRPFTLPPPILPSSLSGSPAEPAAGSSAPADGSAPPATAAGLAPFRDPVALVRALRLPVTPTNVAAAKLALDAPQRLPAALATLESALPDINDPRVATLRTLTAFLGKIEPDSPQLDTQIAAYVDNVVVGGEAKLATLLAGQLLAAPAPELPPAAAAPAALPAAAPGGEAAGAAPAAAAAPATEPAPPEPALPVIALAQIAERGAAMLSDLKTQLLALIGSPPAAAAAGDDLIPAAASALTAVTAVQLNAAQALAATPQQVTFAIPLWLGSGYAQARLSIDRDAPQPRGGAIDGDNFHIAFVLDTKNLGTVTVDLLTVGRAFSLRVKTENERTAQRFSQELGRLTGRLETLRYRVDSADATVARPAAPVAATTSPAATGAAADDVDLTA